MSTYRLETLLDPRSIAVVGAGEREGSVGRAVIDALRAGGFPGPVHAVNPNHATIDGAPCFADLGAIPEPPDVVVIATRPEPVPEIVTTAARAGSAAAVVLTAHLGLARSAPIEAARRIAREHGLRLIGPDSIGVSVPAKNLNATLLARAPRAGDVALVSQSGTVASAIAEWAWRRDLGFSGIVTLGASADVDVADCLDHFAADIHTRAILLSLGAIADARKFLSAARAAARVKPVVVLRTGRRAPARSPEGDRPATHTGALARPDAVYEAAFRRAGLLAVTDLDAMSAAVEVLARQRPFPGKRLMIVANGYGIGALAADRLADRGGMLAEPAPETLAAVRASLGRAAFPPPRGEESGVGVVPLAAAEPGTATPDSSLQGKGEQSASPPTDASGESPNPLDLGVDALPADYETALTPLLRDRDSDAVLALHVPTARAAAAPVAQAIAAAVAAARKGTSRKKPLLAVSIGEDEAAAHVLAKAGLPLFPTDADAVEGFLHLVRYREAQDDLMRTPDSLPRDFAPDVAAARAVVARALEEGRHWLDPPSVEALLSAYAIPMLPCALAPDPQAAADAAWPLLAQGRTVALKLVSPDIVHKSDVGGVKLGLTAEADVREAAAAMVRRVRAQRPEARITGFGVQAMVPSANDRRELIAGLAEDPVFGPVVVFGRGGTAVEVIDDRALGLPPLDLTLATDQILRTRVARRLCAYRDVPAADIRAIALVLVKLSHIAADIPEIRELDINPLLADADGVLGIDARVRVEAYQPPHRHSGAAKRNPEPTTGRDGVRSSNTPSPDVGSGFSPSASPGMTNDGAVSPMFHVKHFPSRLAIRPYPVEWERDMTLKGRAIRVRPVRPDDEALFAAFFRHVSVDDIRLRFFGPVKDFSHAFLARLTQLDYARAIAFVALDAETDDLDQKMLGAVRLHADANHESGEFAILVRSDIKGYGLGYALMRMMIEWARAEGIGNIEGTVLSENRAMLAVGRRLGFAVKQSEFDAGLNTVCLSLL